MLVSFLFVSVFFAFVLVFPRQVFSLFLDADDEPEGNRSPVYENPERARDRERREREEASRGGAPGNGSGGAPGGSTGGADGDEQTTCRLRFAWLNGNFFFWLLYRFLWLAIGTVFSSVIKRQYPATK